MFIFIFTSKKEIVKFDPKKFLNSFIHYFEKYLKVDIDSKISKLIRKY